MIILVGSEKGGVGKSTLATNISAYLAKQNKDVILVDSDRQGTSSNWFQDRLETNFSKLESVSKYDNIKQTLLDLDKRYEYVIVDSQGRDSVELRTGLLVASSVCLTPVRPSQADLDTIYRMVRLISTAKEINENLKSYCVLAQAPTNPVITEIDEAKTYIGEINELSLMNTIICERKVYRDALAMGAGVMEMSNEKAAQEMTDLCEEILR
jgi:chromosome partitioning protein